MLILPSSLAAAETKNTNPTVNKTPTGTSNTAAGAVIRDPEEGDKEDLDPQVVTRFSVFSVLLELWPMTFQH